MKGKTRTSRPSLAEIRQMLAPPPAVSPTPTPEGVETRSFRLRDVEVRASDDGKTRTFSGYAAVFDEQTEIWPGFRESIASGAFADSIASDEPEDDTAFLLGHDDNPVYVLARKSSGTLSLKEDDTGLLVEAELPDTSAARDLAAVMDRGDVSQMSFGFRVLNDSWHTEDGDDVRVLEKVQLWDVSVVTFPAYPQTSAQLRSLRAALGDERADELEMRFLQRAAAELTAAIESREGKVLSDANRQLVEETVETLGVARDKLSELLSAADGGARSAAAADTSEEPAAEGAPLDLLWRRLRLLELESGRSSQNLR